MMKKVIAVAAVAGVLFLSGCAEQNSSNPTPSENGNLSGNYEYGTVIVEGKPVKCLKMKDSTGNSQYGGLSCNWEEWNEGGR